MASQTQLPTQFREFVAKTLGRQDFEIMALAGDASTRRYFRIVCADDTSVLMAWDKFVDDGHFPFLNVQAHFQRHGVHVPKVLGKSPELGAILLEDLGDLTLERKFWENQNQNLVLPFYKQAIDELIKIHFDATNDRQSQCVAFNIDFNVDKLLWELNYGREHLLLKLCKLNLSAAAMKGLDAEFLSICETLHREPKHICHRDYHSRNLMIKLGKVNVIDFQDARMGPIQYDLVSLLYDSYVNIEDGIREEILDYYLSRVKEVTGTPLDRDHFYSVLRVQLLQRCFKACGSFSSFFNTREDLRYLKYLTPTLQRVSAALVDFPQYPTFRSVIVDNGLLTKDFESMEVPS